MDQFTISKRPLWLILLAAGLGLPLTGNAFGPTVDSTRNITFRVDLGAEVVTGQVWVTGSFNNWALTAASALTRGNNNVYSKTIPIAMAPGAEVLYKFVYNGWPRQEVLSGICRSATGPRSLRFPHRDSTLGLVCYNRCTACDSVRVTFNVDLVNGQTLDPNGLHIVGDFQQWNNVTAPLLNPAGGNRYTFSRYFSKSAYIQYKFLNGGTWGGASEEVVLGPCSFNPNTTPNRWLLVPTRDTALTVAFASCGATLPQQGRRLAFIGSSGTYGTGSARPSYMSFPAQFNKKMGDNSALVVADFGRPGAAMQKVVNGAGISSYWNSSDFPHALSFRPDIVINTLGGNDVKNSLFNTRLYEAHYKDMLDSFRLYSPNVEIYMGTGFRSIVSTEQLCIDSLMPKQQELSAKWGLPYLDFWHPSFDPRWYFTGDSLHPDSNGYAILADYLYQYWNTARPVVTPTADSLKAPAGYAAYWWYKDGNLITPLAGTAVHAIAGAGPGRYKVLVRLDPVSFQRLLSAEVDYLVSTKTAVKARARVYPNPVAQALGIEFPSATRFQASFEVFSVTGLRVKTETALVQRGQNTVTISMDLLPPGTYFLTGKGDDWQIQEFFIKL